MSIRLLFLTTFIASPALVFGGPYSDPHCAAGRDTVVHLFEWKWSDIEAECKRFLGPYGFCAVQVSPASENAVVNNPNRPWWERYQPVSYRNLVTRSGNEQQFRSMVRTCNNAGVRIYVDTVINHMTGGYSGTGTAGSHFDGRSCNFPAVPYSSQDCNGGDNCHSPDGSIRNYNNPEEVRNCDLVGLKDLRLSKDYVRDEIAGYLNHLIDIGVAGFRVDAAKHMWPGDLEAVFARLHNLDSNTFGSGHKPFIYQEVIDMGGEAVKMSEYFGTGRVTNFIYGVKLADIFLRHTNQAKWLVSWGSSWGMPNTNDVVVFLNNHDNQRGHGGGGAPITFRNAKELKIATAFMLAHPYGFPRIMSSYFWTQHIEGGDDTNNWVGPPHNGDMSTKDVSINSDMTCGNGWVCEHRWRQIYNMVAFRNVVSGTGVLNFKSYGDQQISFSRGNKGFIAIVGDNSHLNTNIATGLPSGDYCEVISGNYENGACTGKTIHVDGNGNAHINISGSSDDPVVAIHVGKSIKPRHNVGLSDAEAMEKFMSYLDNPSVKSKLTNQLAPSIDKRIRSIVLPYQVAIKRITENIKLFDDRYDSLEAKYDTLDQYTRRNNIRISGFKETKGENTDDIIVKYAKESLNLNISLTDIDDSYRVGKVTENRPTKDILVHFVSHKTKMQFLKASRAPEEYKAKHKTNHHISEDLTPIRSNMAIKARRLKLKGLIKDTWTDDGNVFIKENNDNVSICTTLACLERF